MSDMYKAAMKKLASDPKAQAAAQMIEKLAYNTYMRTVQATLTKAAEAEEMMGMPAEGMPVGPAEEMPGEPSEEEAIMMVAEMIEADPDSVPDEVKAEFVEAIMGDPQLEAAVEQEVKEGMRRDMYKRAFYDQQSVASGQPTRREMYKNAFYQGAQQDMLRKTAEDLAVANTLEGEVVDPEMVEAIIELIEESAGGGEEIPMDEDLTEEELSPEMVADALAESGDPILEGDGKEVIAQKVANLIQANHDAGRVKVASALFHTYFPE